MRYVSSAKGLFVLCTVNTFVMVFTHLSIVYLIVKTSLGVILLFVLLYQNLSFTDSWSMTCLSKLLCCFCWLCWGEKTFVSVLIILLFSPSLCSAFSPRSELFVSFPVRVFCPACGLWSLSSMWWCSCCLLLYAVSCRSTLHLLHLPLLLPRPPKSSSSVVSAKIKTTKHTRSSHVFPVLLLLFLALLFSLRHVCPPLDTCCLF